jgi:hypothetical protein
MALPDSTELAEVSADSDEMSKLLLAAERLRLVRRAAKRFYMLGKLERELLMVRADPGVRHQGSASRRRIRFEDTDE